MFELDCFVFFNLLFDVVLIVKLIIQVCLERCSKYGVFKHKIDWNIVIFQWEYFASSIKDLFI